MKMLVYMQEKEGRIVERKEGRKVIFKI